MCHKWSLQVTLRRVPLALSASIKESKITAQARTIEASTKVGAIPEAKSIPEAKNRKTVDAASAARTRAEAKSKAAEATVKA